MSYDFKSASELLSLCKSNGMSIAEVMAAREMELSGMSRTMLMGKVDDRLRVMEASTNRDVDEPVSSMGGLIGGEARMLRGLDSSKIVCGRMMHRAMISALSVAETNASMGMIVAAPTAGSAGVVPSVILSLFGDSEDMEMDTLRKGLINAGAIGYLCTRNGSVSGAEAGCQAEVGSAAAMAASALAEMLGGTPEQCCDAASIAISNLLGLVCDPIRGLVEVPCQTRNVIGVSCAFTSAELALSGITFPVKLDEMIGIMTDVGRGMPEALRETGKGGCACASSACSALSGSNEKL